MRTTAEKTFTYIIAAVLCGMGSTLRAGEPTTGEMDIAIKSGDFAGFQTVAAAWLDDNVPPRPRKEALQALLMDDEFRTVLAQWQLISKTGADKLGAFAKADSANQEFLGWLMKNSQAMDLYLVAKVPIGLKDREANTYTLDTAALEIWKQIRKADPDAQDGIYQELAIATAIQPPGSINIGAGRAETPANPVVRYMHFKNAYRHKELVPSFDNLSVWEYSHVVSSGASDADLAWGREMIRTFRPGLLENEKVIRATSLVWRRAAPARFYPNGYVNFKNVLAGGGKCGPKSSFAVFISQAHGVPAIGVGQPGHACAAYKSAYPETQPQPGNAWKVDYGRGWEVSKLIGLSGTDFLAGVKERAHSEEFSQVEHMRWLAASLARPERATPVMEIAHALQKSLADIKPAPDASRTPKAPSGNPTPRESPEPVKAYDGVIHVEAAAFAKTGGKISWDGQKPYVEVYDCYTGGKQVYFEQQMKEQWADYVVDVRSSGIHEIVMKAACINVDQSLEVCVGTNVIATVPIPLEYGLWVQTSPVALQLEKGVQTLRIQTSTKQHMRGIALRWFELRAN